VAEQRGAGDAEASGAWWGDAEASSAGRRERLAIGASSRGRRRTGVTGRWDPLIGGQNIGCHISVHGGIHSSLEGHVCKAGLQNHLGGLNTARKMGIRPCLLVPSTFKTGTKWFPEAIKYRF
jgi:hypothetical protein